jgi:hypothetical protein
VVRPRTLEKPPGEGHVVAQSVALQIFRQSVGRNAEFGAGLGVVGNIYTRALQAKKGNAMEALKA